MRSASERINEALMDTAYTADDEYIHQLLAEELEDEGSGEWLTIKPVSSHEVMVRAEDAYVVLGR